MCDTIVVMPNASASGKMLFAKNSDREPNEAQPVEYHPAADHAPGEMLKCTYIEIPQAAHTHAVFLSRPFWIWGAEIGTNEYGVTIGNEAVFARVPYEYGESLIGMDYLRLGLERGATAREALEVITALLKEYGQAGNCGFEHKLLYFNSFLIADPEEAWVLETVNREWAAKRIEDYYTISNRLTIGNQFDLSSDNLVSYAVEKGWCKGREDFNFAENYKDFIFTTFSDSGGRRCQTMDSLEPLAGQVTVQDLMGILRNHRYNPGSWSPDQRLYGADVCCHASWGPIRGSQTTGSMVSELGKDVQMHFYTGTAAPCTSVFKPFWFDVPLPSTGPQPAGKFTEGSLFWEHEKLHRATLLNYRENINKYAGSRDALEQGFVEGALNLADAAPEQRAKWVEYCYQAARSAEEQWLEVLQKAGSPRKQKFFHRLAWNKWNRDAGMDLG